MIITDKLSLHRGTPSTSRKDNPSSKSKNKRRKSPVPLLDIQFDDNGLIDLTNHEVKSIQNYFFVFARNRSNYLSERYHK